MVNELVITSVDDPGESDSSSDTNQIRDGEVCYCTGTTHQAGCTYYTSTNTYYWTSGMKIFTELYDSLYGIHEFKHKTSMQDLQKAMEKVQLCGAEPTQALGKGVRNDPYTRHKSNRGAGAKFYKKRLK